VLPRCVKRAILPVVGLLMVMCASVAAAQTWPGKPVRIVVPYPPGGGNDVIARLLAPKLSERWGQPVVVDNRPGAAGNLGAGEVARAAPDGHTLLMAVSTIAMTPGLGQKVTYALDKDLVAVAMAATTAMVIAVHPDVPAKSLSELIAAARAQPGRYAYSTCGNASPMHLAGELLKLNAGIDLVHIPYKGCAPALTDTVAGQVPVAFNTISNAVGYDKGGRVRILAVVSRERLAQFPNIPAAHEAGMKGYEADIWFGLFAPAQTPPAVVAEINAAVNQALADPGVQEKLRVQYYEPRPASAASFQKFVQDETEKWTRTIRAAGIKAD
jgi:tripartite-type tricarboxylate transporter receptor subunit TctC